jgi:hypothetical protein
MSDIKLLPFPHCGSDAVLYESRIGWSVCCQNTESPPCDIGNTHHDWTREAVIEMWNRRSQPPISPPANAAD